MVKDITIEGNKVAVTLAVPFSGIPIKDLLINSVREPIEKLGAKVEMKLAIMNQQELQAFLAMEHESWKAIYGLKIIGKGYSCVLIIPHRRLKSAGLWQNIMTH
jgi:metal-sulfur cluster biosynthetic enzyme